jgi:L-lactate dehydrogenase complex protein LldF
MNMASGKTKNRVIAKMFSKSWGERRNLPEFAPKSFNELWREKKPKR